MSFILHSLHFIIDFACVSEKLFFVHFSDDANIYLNSKDNNKFAEIIQLELFELYNWLQINKLTLYFSKTYFIVFHIAKHTINNISITLNRITLNK